MKKLNCWQFKKCGRGPVGHRVAELGVCAAATKTATNGIHGGLNGGRICWAISHTLCKGEKQGTFGEKFAYCLKCDFFQLVQSEQGRFFQLRETLTHHRNRF